MAKLLSPAHARPSVPPDAGSLGIELALGETSGEVVVRVSGEAGVRQADRLTAALARLNALRPPLVTLDLAGLRSVSCLALGVLASFHRGLVCAGGRVRLAPALREPVRQALERAGLLALVGLPEREEGPRSGAIVTSGERQVRS